MTVQLKDGFEVEVIDSALNSWSLLKLFRSIDKGETGLVVDVAEKLLGEEQADKLVEHCGDEADAMIAAIGEIIESINQLKNS